VIEFKKLIARLKKAYGEPALPPARGPFELVMWENACYLLPDERRAAVFEGLRQQVGMDAESIWKADQARNAGVSLAGNRPHRHLAVCRRSRLDSRIAI
jgi:hypothetical protein